MHSVTSLWEWKPTSGVSLSHKLCSTDSVSFIHPLLDSKKREIFFKKFYFSSHSFTWKLQQRYGWALWNQLISMHVHYLAKIFWQMYRHTFISGIGNKNLKYLLGCVAWTVKIHLQWGSLALIPGSGRFPVGGHSNRLQ